MHIIRVSDSQTEKAFIQFPARVYKNSKHWVRPLDQEIKKLFDKGKNPFFENGEAERWILTNFRGRMIGRIAAFVDNKVSGPHGGPIGGMGFFECIDHQVAAFTLFDQSRDWLSRKGVEVMRGPVNFLNFTSKSGLLTEGFAEQPVYGMPYHHEYYQRFFENYGFCLQHKIYNYTTDIRENFLSTEFREKGNKILSDPDYRTTSIYQQDIEQVAGNLMEVYNDAWKEQDCFFPMTRELARDMLQRLQQVMDKKIIYFVYHQEKPVAFFLNLPEVNGLYKYMNGRINAIGKLKYLLNGERSQKIVGLMMGVKKAYQGKGIEAALAVTLENHLMSSASKYQSLEVVGVGDADAKILHIVRQLKMKVNKVFHTYEFNLHQNRDTVERRLETGDRKTKNCSLKIRTVRNHV